MKWLLLQKVIALKQNKLFQSSFDHVTSVCVTGVDSFLMSFRENEEENLAHTVFTQYINEHENQMEAELAFDASFFKANRKVNCFVTFILHLI